MYDTYHCIFVHILWVKVGVIQGFVFVGAGSRVIWLLTIIYGCGIVLWLLARTLQNSLNINHIYPNILLYYLNVLLSKFLYFNHVLLRYFCCWITRAFNWGIHVNSLTHSRWDTVTFTVRICSNWNWDCTKIYYFVLSWH